VLWFAAPGFSGTDVFIYKDAGDAGCNLAMCRGFYSLGLPGTDDLQSHLFVSNGPSWCRSAFWIRFTPAILPPYARRSGGLEVPIPIHYLKGIFEETRAALVGKDAPGLSASTIARLRRSGSTSTSIGRSAICRPSATSLDPARLTTARFEAVSDNVDFDGGLPPT
jgi:hypothetical protein